MNHLVLEPFKRFGPASIVNIAMGIVLANSTEESIRVDRFEVGILISNCLDKKEKRLR